MKIIQTAVRENCQRLLLESLAAVSRTNELVLSDIAHAYGFERSRHLILDQIDALDEQLLTTSDMFNGIRVVEITPKGRTHVRDCRRFSDGLEGVAARVSRARVQLNAVEAAVETRSKVLEGIEEWLADLRSSSVKSV